MYSNVSPVLYYSITLPQYQNVETSIIVVSLSGSSNATQRKPPIVPTIQSASSSMILFSRKKPALSVLLATAFAIFASTASPVVVAQKNADQNASLLLGSISLNSDHKDADVMTDEDPTAIESITLDGTPVLAAEDTTKTDLLPPSSDDRSDRKEDPTALAADNVDWAIRSH